MTRPLIVLTLAMLTVAWTTVLNDADPIPCDAAFLAYIASAQTRSGAAMQIYCGHHLANLEETVLYVGALIDDHPEYDWMNSWTVNPGRATRAFANDADTERVGVWLHQVPDLGGVVVSLARAQR